MRTEREKFLAQLKKKMIHGETASERLQATKMFGEMTYGLTADGKLTSGEPIDGAIPLPPLQPDPPKKLSDFEQAAAFRDVSHVIKPAKLLADEACAFICWRQGMGEDDGAATWGDWQRTYTINLTAKHYALAVQLTIAMADAGVNPEREWNRVFNFEKGGQYPQAILDRARLALKV